MILCIFILWNISLWRQRRILRRGYFPVRHERQSVYIRRWPGCKQGCLPVNTVRSSLLTARIKTGLLRRFPRKEMSLNQLTEEKNQRKRAPRQNIFFGCYEDNLDNSKPKGGLLTWFLPQRGCLMMLMTGLKQLIPLWSPYTPCRWQSLYLARTSMEVAEATSQITSLLVNASPQMQKMKIKKHIF